MEPLITLDQANGVATTEGKRTRNRRPLLTHEATVVLSAQKGHEDVWVRIEIIFGKRFGHLVELLALSERMTNWIKEREVEQRRHLLHRLLPP